MWLRVGCWMLATVIVTGAFGAHGLEDRLAPDRLELWETAVRYLAYAGLAVMLLGVAERPSGGPLRGTAAVVAGSAIFSGTVFALALGAPGWFGAITPFGGVSMIVGFLLAGWDATR
ncbi:MAG: DUF423 domain-containing protein [Acidobacteriota bacterium]